MVIFSLPLNLAQHHLPRPTLSSPSWFALCASALNIPSAMLPGWNWLECSSSLLNVVNHWMHSTNLLCIPVTFVHMAAHPSSGNAIISILLFVTNCHRYMYLTSPSPAVSNPLIFCKYTHTMFFLFEMYLPKPLSDLWLLGYSLSVASIVSIPVLPAPPVWPLPPSIGLTEYALHWSLSPQCWWVAALFCYPAFWLPG